MQTYFTIERLVGKRNRFACVPGYKEDKEVQTPRQEDVQQTEASTLIIVVAEHLPPSIVLWHFHKQLLYPCHLQRVARLTPPRLRLAVESWQWLVSNCAGNPRCLYHMLFADDAGLTRDGHKNSTINICGRINWRHYSAIARTTILSRSVGRHNITAIAFWHRMKRVIYHFWLQTYPYLRSFSLHSYRLTQFLLYYHS
jgi:hypothetical protein